MKTRIISALIMLPLLIVVIIGGLTLKIAVFLLGAMALREFYNAFHKIKIKPFISVGIFSMLILYSINIFKLSLEYYMLWLVITVFLILLYMFKMDKHEIQDASITLFGIMYVSLFSYHVVLIDDIAKFEIFIWMVFITAFITDIMAYFSGYLFGKHKLCPSISPKKTIEGSIGGTLCCVLISGIFGYFFAKGFIVDCLILGFIGSIAGQLGDLTASIIKRKIGIKDFSDLIPGHGGVLDRIDSVLFTAPVVYYYLIIVMV